MGKIKPGKYITVTGCGSLLTLQGAACSTYSGQVHTFSRGVVFIVSGVCACLHTSTHTHIAIVTEGSQLVTSSRAKFISIWSAEAWRLSKAVLSSLCLKLPEPSDYLPAVRICLPRPEFASLYGRRLSLLRRNFHTEFISAREVLVASNPGVCLNNCLVYLLSQGFEQMKWERYLIGGALILSNSHCWEAVKAAFQRYTEKKIIY